MKVLFAVHDEKVSLSIVKKYQKEYKEIISYKNVYYFNAILKEIQRDRSYDRVVIDEDLEEFTSTSYEEKDKFVFNKLDGITDEASNSKGKDIPIILICTERRAKGEDILVKLFGIGIYNAIIGNDRSTDEVCRLINTPRSKKLAKSYYKIDSKNVEYDPEDENDVSEEEMQHILSYFKKLGKNADKYDECFRKISSQYNEKQMKIIVAILPQNVKEILQDVSSEYQKYVPYSPTRNIKVSKYKTINLEPTSEKLLNYENNDNKKQIIVPSTLDKNLIKKVSRKRTTAIEEAVDDEDDEDFDEDNNFEEKNKIEEEVVETPKRRGRPPKKVKNEEEEAPKKKIKSIAKNFDLDEIEDGQVSISQLNDDYEDDLPGGKEIKNNKYKQIDESLLRPEPISEGILPGIEDDDDDDDFEDNQRNMRNENNYNYREEIDEESQDYNTDYQRGYESDDYDLGISNNPVQHREIQNYEQSDFDYDYTNYNNLLSSERKVIAFVGTSKNGTSFIVNNIAKVLSENGINTAILDATQNKNSYYIYNNNDDELRGAAASSLENLIQGMHGGMRVSRNLSVYVEMPGQNSTRISDVGPILENLVKNHSATLIDCDFSTPIEYFANVQEIYLVQSMDVLTIQPLTAFLKELKNRDILNQQKIRIIMNKVVRLKGITSKKIVGGMSRYNNPEMSMMTELFDRNLIVPIEIPFDIDVYARYLEGLAECSITTNRYPKDFQNILNKLSNIVYPLLPAKRSNEKYTNGYTSGFSNNVNNTLNNMRKKY